MNNTINNFDNDKSLLITGWFLQKPLDESISCFHTKKRAQNLLGLLGLLGQEHLVHVGEDTTSSNGDVAEELVQLFVVADSELKVAGDDAAALVVAGGISSELQDFSAQVLEHSSEVDWCSSSEARCQVLLAHVTGNASDRELQTGAG